MSDAIYQHQEFTRCAHSPQELRTAAAALLSELGNVRIAIRPRVRETEHATKHPCLSCMLQDVGGLSDEELEPIFVHANEGTAYLCATFA